MRYFLFVYFLINAAFQDAALTRGRCLLDGGVFTNNWLKVRRLSEGGVL